MPPAPQTRNAPFSRKFQPLFEPKRYKVYWGGRGAGRSWGFARALLLMGTKRPLRVLCAREFQNSISESVHKVLSDQIEALGLGAEYTIQKDRIFSANGTSFFFEGIKNNAGRIKSYEGIDVCWVEEANKVSQASWEFLTPTIRKKGSEIWMSFNPELEKDYTYQRFVVKANPELMTVVHMTYRDNPWFAETSLEDERAEMERTDEDAYQNVWEGRIREILEGVIFAKELREAQKLGHITDVPWDRETPVDCFWDLGRRDLTAIWFAQRVALQWRILEYYEDRAQDIQHYLNLIQKKRYVIGSMVLPHDAKAKQLGSARSIEQIVRKMGFRVQVVPRTPKKANAINAARTIFSQCWFDEEKCKEGLTRLKTYKYKVIDGQYSDEPLHDDASNGADAFMTLAQAIKGNSLTTEGFLARLENGPIGRFLGTTDDFSGREAAQSWMG